MLFRSNFGARFLHRLFAVTTSLEFPSGLPDARAGRCCIAISDGTTGQLRPVW